MFRLLICLSLLLMTFRCCPGEKYCYECNDTSFISKCTSCAFSLYDQNTNSCITNFEKIDNCVKYQKPGPGLIVACLNCERGYRRTDKDTCERCADENCSSCIDDKNKCDACFSRMTLEDGLCSNKQKCQQDKCEICSYDNELCLRCQDGYSLNHDWNCVESSEGCVRLNKDGDECMECDYDYFLNKQYKCSLNEEKSSTWSIWLLLIIIIIIIIIGVVFLIRVCKKDRNFVPVGDMASDMEEEIVDKE